VQVPTRGVALFINAFNFASWGLWEKAAPALLSGVPVIVKPATSTAWLTQRMVKDVVDAGIFPAGALSIICGSSAGLLDQLQPFDVVSFTGSADTAAVIRSHPAVVQRSVRVNIEADSVNSALLLPSASAEDTQAALDLLVKEVAREMTVKSGQKCTAIRRVFVPEALYDTAAAAISARLAKTTVGNPRNEAVRMGALVSRTQLAAVREGLAQLKAHTDVLHDGASHPHRRRPGVACCIAPTLLGTRNPDGCAIVHDVEVFGPVATLMPYRDTAHALALVRRGQGSLVASLYGTDPAALSAAALELADSHGRVHVISPDVAALHTGHGNVMPQSLHGGPGRAGGGEELGGLRRSTSTTGAAPCRPARPCCRQSVSNSVEKRQGRFTYKHETTMTTPGRPRPRRAFNFAQHLLDCNAHAPGQGRLRRRPGHPVLRRAGRPRAPRGGGLRAAGPAREERVLLLMHDGNDWPVSFLGAMYAGLVPVAVNTLLTADDYAYMLEHSRAQAVLVSGALLPALTMRHGQGDHEVAKVIVSRPVAPLHPAEVEFESLCRAAPRRWPSPPPAPTIPASGSIRGLHRPPQGHGAFARQPLLDGRAVRQRRAGLTETTCASRRPSCSSPTAWATR
jgi:acyl-CoA reductase-like NAD-dependent aldehyde dehydrogenase